MSNNVVCAHIQHYVRSYDCLLGVIDVCFLLSKQHANKQANESISNFYLFYFFVYMKKKQNKRDGDANDIKEALVLVIVIVVVVIT